LAQKIAAPVTLFVERNGGNKPGISLVTSVGFLDQISLDWSGWRRHVG
jgi:hypothetical protein